MKTLSSQRRLSAQIMKVGESRVWFDTNRINEIKEAITKSDLRKLIKDLAIQAKPQVAISKFRSRKLKIQKKKGRKRGEGSKKGKRTSRLPKKRAWINRVRAQRGFMKELKHKGLLENKVFRDIYNKVNGGFFRSRRHIKIYLNDLNLFKKK